MSSGPAGAASRKLAVWVGGDEKVFNQHKAILDAIGDRTASLGAIGSATVAKLVHNMSGYAIVCALAETFTLGAKAGMDPLTLCQAVRQGAVGRRFTFDALTDQFLPGEYDPPAFALSLLTRLRILRPPRVLPKLTTHEMAHLSEVSGANAFRISD